MNNRLNIYDINLILIFVGFPLFTTFVNSSVGSIIYRAIALLIGLSCIIQSHFRVSVSKGNKSFILFILIYALLTLKMVYEESLGEDAYTPYIASRNFLLIFCFGVGWVPFLGAICGFDKIHKHKVISVTFFILLFIISVGLLNQGMNTTDVGRVSLNERQSSLAFGDNAAYLSIISACILKFKKHLPKYYKYLAIAGFFMGIFACVSAASRGPLVSMFVGLFFVFHTLKGSSKLTLSVIILFCIFSGFLSFALIEKISPAMAERINLSIESGDTSGRDVLFEEAWAKITENPVTGSNPIILEPSSFSGYHNVYLGTGVGLGIFGFVLFLSLMLSLLARSFIQHECYDNLFNVAIFGLFWFYACRGITGVGILTNAIFDVLVAYTCLIIHSNSNKLNE